MEETLKMMKQVLLGNERGKELKDLIEEYKQNQNPNILAYMFINNYGLIANISKSYPIIDNSDAASYSLQELDKCLFSYNFSTTFCTYFSTCYKNRLRAEAGLLNTYKRKIFFNTEELTDTNTSIIYDDYFDINEFCNEHKLNNIQKAQCKLINDGYKPKEICKILKKSLVRIYKINNEIKQKIIDSSINLA